MPPSVTINVILDCGGIGDAIARAPAVEAVAKDYPDNKYRLFVYFEVLQLYQEWFKNTPNILGVHDIRLYHHLAKEGEYVVAMEEMRQYQLGMHLTDLAYMTIAKRLPYRKLPYLPLPIDYSVEKENTVVLTPNYTALSRSLPTPTWQGVIAGVKKAGLTPILLGSSKPDLFKGTSDLSGEGCLDLRNKTTLLEAAQIMQRSRCVVGLDNGLLHLAACTTTPIVVMYSTQIPENRLFVRDKGEIRVMMPRSGCQGCETWYRFDANHNFRFCIDNSYACTKSFRAGDILREIKKAVDNDLG